MALKTVLGWLKAKFGPCNPYLATGGGASVYIVMNGKKVTLSDSELCHDDEGSCMSVFVPENIGWDGAAGEPMTAAERTAVVEVLQNKENWRRGERFEVYIPSNEENF